MRVPSLISYVKVWGFCLLRMEPLLGIKASLRKGCLMVKVLTSTRMAKNTRKVFLRRVNCLDMVLFALLVGLSTTRANARTVSSMAMVLSTTRVRATTKKCSKATGKTIAVMVLALRTLLKA